MDVMIASELGIPSQPLSVPMDARALDGRSTGEVTHSTVPVQLRFSGNHSETIQFLIASPHVPVVLGLSWLQKHNPMIDWTTSSILGWSPFCHSHCLQAAQPSSSRLPQDVSKTVDVSAIPTEYHDLLEVFSKARATSLPPHRPYDCAIDLLPGTTPPRGRLYSLSVWPLGPTSVSPAGAGFFFVEKDKTLRPCIDYRGLNDITVKNHYPYLSSVFEPLRWATIFSKLDLRNAYHLVRMHEEDEWKTAFNTASGHNEYQVMPFGLTNTVFQALVNVLRDMLNRFVFVYLDDILFFSRTAQEHVLHVRQVLQRLLENQLFVKAEKCEFHRCTITFLGYVIAEGNVQMDPGKVKAVVDWPQPTSRVQLQRFLGFANFYRHFIRDYSTLAAPLSALTSPKVPLK
uniref:ribonuclease H n=1 Tax=Hucho hucho TaxID=62062 RepID=A0A4W5NN01_9TELE